MRRFRHPSKRALQAWLADPDDTTIDSHLASCQRCANTLEELEEAGAAGIGDALAAFYAPPPDLSERLERKVVARLDSRAVLGVVSDLFGAGLETTRLLLTEEHGNE